MTSSFSGFVRQWILPFADPRRFASVALLPKFFLEFKRYRAMSVGERVAWHDLYPCFLDRVTQTPFDPHYFFQAAWLARRLQERRPSFHVDIGSSTMMINVLSANVRMAFVDYRPLQARLSNLSSLAGDIVRLPFRDASIGSLSCLHVIEHVGLGRYGDPVNPAGSRLAAAELQRVVQPGGRLFLSVPVGRERVCFNAHRVFSSNTIQSFFPELQLESFSLIDDAGHFREHIPTIYGNELEYGCGLFEFVKAHA